MTTTTVPRGTTTDISTSRRLRLVAAGLAGSATTLAVVVAIHPWGERIDSSSDELLVHDTVAEHRTGTFVGVLVDGFAFAVLGVCVALAVCHLVRGRGRVPATVGSVLVVAGGILSAMGGLGFATAAWLVTGVPEDSSADVVAYANDQQAHLMGAQMAGFLLFTLGSLVLAFALFRSRAVPVAAVALFVFLTLALFVASGSPTGSDVVQVAQTLVVGALALPLWRRS